MSDNNFSPAQVGVFTKRRYLFGFEIVAEPHEIADIRSHVAELIDSAEVKLHFEDLGPADVDRGSLQAQGAVVAEAMMTSLLRRYASVEIAMAVGGVRGLLRAVNARASPDDADAD